MKAQIIAQILESPSCNVCSKQRSWKDASNRVEGATRTHELSLTQVSLMTTPNVLTNNSKSQGLVHNPLELGTDLVGWWKVEW